MSAGILALGLIAVLLLLNTGDRKRERRAGRIVLDDPASHVEATLGPPPVRCPPGSLQHLAARFPGGTPRVARESTLAELRAQTAERWIYPSGDDDADCSVGEGSTEIGLNRDRRVVWIVPVAGRKPLVYPVPRS